MYSTPVWPSTPLLAWSPSPRPPSPSSSPPQSSSRSTMSSTLRRPVSCQIISLLSNTPLINKSKGQELDKKHFLRDGVSVWNLQNWVWNAYWVFSQWHSVSSEAILPPWVMDMVALIPISEYCHCLPYTSGDIVLLWMAVLRGWYKRVCIPYFSGQSHHRHHGWPIVSDRIFLCHFKPKVCQYQWSTRSLWGERWENTE